MISDHWFTMIRDWNISETLVKIILATWFYHPSTLVFLPLWLLLGNRLQLVLSSFTTTRPRWPTPNNKLFVVFSFSNKKWHSRLLNQLIVSWPNKSNFSLQAGLEVVLIKLSCGWLPVKMKTMLNLASVGVRVEYGIYASLSLSIHIAQPKPQLKWGWVGFIRYWSHHPLTQESFST